MRDSLAGVVELTSNRAPRFQRSSGGRRDDAKGAGADVLTDGIKSLVSFIADDIDAVKNKTDEIVGTLAQFTLDEAKSRFPRMERADRLPRHRDSRRRIDFQKIEFSTNRMFDRDALGRHRPLA